MLLSTKKAGVAQSVYRLCYGLDDRGSFPGRGNDGIIFLFATVNRLTLGISQAPIQ